jgi:hypothetical protein
MNSIELDQDRFKTYFLNFIQDTGGSSLYCLSALSIIWGLFQVMTPILTSDALNEKIFCILSIALYELMLLAMYAFLKIKRGFSSTALTIILGIFFMANGLLLNTIASDNASLGILIGCGLFAFTALKLHLLRRYAQINFGPRKTIGLLFLTYINFIMPGLVATHFEEALTVGQIWRQALNLMNFTLLVSYLNFNTVTQDDDSKRIFYALSFILSSLNIWAMCPNTN